MLKFLIAGSVKEGLTDLENLLSETFNESVISWSAMEEDFPRKVREEKPDVIFLDVADQESDCLQICTALKSDEELRHLPVLLLITSGTTAELKAEAVRIGIDGFLNLPAGEADVVAQVTTMLRIRNFEERIRNEWELLAQLVADRTRELVTKLEEKSKAERNLTSSVEKLEKTRIASLNLMEDLKGEITVRKKVEDDLRASESRYRSLFESMQEGFALHELITGENGQPVDYRFLEVNPTYGKLMGYSPDALIGKTMREIQPSEPPARLREYAYVAMEGEKIKFEHYSKSQSKFYRIYAFSTKPGQFATIIEDITDRMIYQKMLKENEEKFRIIFESVGNGIVYMTRQGRILDVNPAFERISGIQKETLVGRGIFELLKNNLPGPVFSDLLHKFSDVLSGKQTEPQDFTLGDRYLKLENYLSGDGKTITSVIYDLTEQRRAEEARMKLLVRHETLLGAVPDILMEVNKSLEYTWANQAASRFFGKEVTGKRVDFYFEGGQNNVQLLQPVMDGKIPTVYFESWQRRKDGVKRLLAWRFNSMKNNEGEVTGAFSSARDITGIKNKEEELRRSHQQLKELNLYLQKVREEERRLISRELHDELGQLLTAVKIDLGSLSPFLKGDANLESKAGKILGLINDSITTVKRLTAELRPHILDDLGLNASLEWYVSEYRERTGIQVSLNLIEPLNLNPEHQLVVFRIIQESLTNIARHSRAGNASISFREDIRGLRFEVTDDGIGMDPSEVRPGRSFGILNMTERAKEIGGKLVVESLPGNGTKIKVFIPVED